MRNLDPVTESMRASEVVESGRRGFLVRLIMFLGGAVALSAGKKAVSAKNSIIAASQTAQNALANHPRPSRLPDGFSEVAAISGLPSTNPKDGFGGRADELVLWYKHRTHVQGFNHPLCIFVTSNPQKEFTGTEQHQGEVVEIVLRSGSTVSAEYHNGMWSLDSDHNVKWDSRNVHSLVFRLNQFTVGIRGARAVGITFDKLMLIARSFG